MKFVLIGVLSFFVVATRAATCPPLAGTYQCQYQGFEAEVTVTERARTGFTIYVVDYGMGAITIQPDGLPHFIDRLPGVESVQKFKYRGSCGGNSVSFNGTGELTDGSGTGSMTGSVSKQGSRIVITVNVNAKGKASEGVRLVCN